MGCNSGGALWHSQICIRMRVLHLTSSAHLILPFLQLRSQGQVVLCLLEWGRLLSSLGKQSQSLPDKYRWRRALLALLVFAAHGHQNRVLARLQKLLVSANISGRQNSTERPAYLGRTWPAP